jgi:hypothetical protein
LVYPQLLDEPSDESRPATLEAPLLEVLEVILEAPFLGVPFLKAILGGATSGLCI